MSADPLALGSHVRLQQITPTELSEQVYHAKLALRQNKPMPVGPAGLPIPSPMAIYRPTIDKSLMPNLVRASYRAHCERELPAASEEAASAAAAREIDRLFPAADMAVLARYGLTRQAEWISLHLLTPAEFITQRVTLDPAVTVPRGAEIGFHVDLGGSQPVHVPPAPADLVPYGRTIAELRRAKPLFDKPLGWASQFKARNGRWPKWLEIEREFPTLGSWLAEQRAAIAETPNV